MQHTTARRYSTATIFVLAAIASILFASSASAQFEAGNWEVGFTVGAIDFDDNVRDGSSTEPFITARAGYFFTDNFELELQAGDTHNIFSPDLQVVFLNGVWNFLPENKVVPYVSAGVGLADLTLGTRLFGDSVSVNDDSTAFQAAVGTRFMFTDESRWGMRVELASIFEDTFDESSNHLLLSGGFTFRIGS